MKLSKLILTATIAGSLFTGAFAQDEDRSEVFEQIKAIKEQVKAGEITREEAKDQIKALIGELPERPERPEKPDHRDRGKWSDLSDEEKAALKEEWKAKKEARKAVREEMKALKEELKAQVEAGEITREEAKEAMKAKREELISALKG